ncbi:MAG TPA: hypothetical protein VNP98_16915 [Chthoniobacterales bacterium]|nr:hypothetical protein [Chthoniobacterales bacterium]
MKILIFEPIHYSTFTDMDVAPREISTAKTNAKKLSHAYARSVASWVKCLALLVLLGALVFGNVSSTQAGDMHARVYLYPGLSSSSTGHGGVAHVERRRNNKYCIAHEQFGNNYVRCNAGDGHAHHHSGRDRPAARGEQDNSSPQGTPTPTPPPVPGEPGTSYYVNQTWLPTSVAGDVEVRWTPDSFLQVDPSEIAPGLPTVLAASLTADGGLTGTVELSGLRNGDQEPQINAHLTGIFAGKQFKLVTHPNGVVSFQFTEPLAWTVQGDPETFEIALDASIDTAEPQNISTRVLTQTGDNVGIGGFIITGTAPKHVVIRAIGPSLSQLGVPNALADPVLELHSPSPFGTITNDNWRDDPAQEAAIIATGLAPTNNLESAIDATLPPGAYTAIIRGSNNNTGVALVEVYDLNPGADSKLANISTRALVGTGDNIVIAGFIMGSHGGDGGIVVRGIGPSLTALGVPNALADPTLELRDGNAALLISNNDWQDDPTQATDLTDAGLAPTSQLEAGIATALPPGLYTVLLAGRNNSTGVGVVEVYSGGP